MAGELFKALMENQYSASESPWGVGALALSQAAPALYNPYASMKSNAIYSIGSGLVAGLLGGLAKRQARQENADLFSQALAMKSAAPEQMASMMADNPRLASYGLALQDQRDQRALELEQQKQHFDQQLAFKQRELETLGPLQTRQDVISKTAQAMAESGYGPDEIMTAVDKYSGQPPAQTNPMTSLSPQTQAGIHTEAGKMLTQSLSEPPVANQDSRVNLQPSIEGAPAQEIDRLRELTRQTRNPTVAARLYEKEIEKEEAEKKTIADHLKEQSTELQQSKALVDNLKFSISNAGETGGFDTLTGLTTYAGYLLGGEESTKNLQGRRELNSQSLEVAGQIKKLFPGNPTEREMAMFMQASPGTGITREENIALVNKMDRAAQLKAQYIAFIEEASKQGVSLSDAKLAYNKFDSAVPTFVRTEKGLEVNPDKLAIDPSSLNIRELVNSPFMGFQKKNEVAGEGNKPPPAVQPINGIDAMMNAPKGESPGMLSNAWNNLTSADWWLTRPSGEKISAGQAIAGPGMAALDTLTAGHGDEITAGGNALVDSLVGGPGYDERLKQARGVQESFKQASPGADLAVRVMAGKGLPLGTSIKSGDGLVAGLTKASAEGAGYGAVYGFGEGEGGAANRLAEAKAGAKTGAIAGPVIHGAGKAISGAASMTEAVAKKLFGIGKADYNQVAKSFSKVDAAAAKKSVNNALSIIEKEQGIGIRETAKGSEQFYIDMISKAKSSQQSRQNVVNTVVNKVDEAMYQGKDIYFKITPEQVLRGKKVGLIEMPELKKEVAKQLRSLNAANSGKGLTLKDLHTQKQLLNRSYNTQAEMNAGKAITDTMRRLVEKTVTAAAEKNVIPREMGTVVRDMNNQSRDLINLMSVYAKKVPGQAADDLMSSVQGAFWTTGRGGAPGAAVIGEKLGGEAGGKLGAVLGLLGQTTPVTRPLAYGASKAAPYVNKYVGQPLQQMGPMPGFASLDAPKKKDVASMLDIPKGNPTPEGIQRFLKQPPQTNPNLVAQAQPQQQGPDYFDMPLEELTQRQVEQPKMMAQMQPQKQDVAAIVEQQHPFIKAVIAQESAGKPNAVSQKGAQGLMQLMPGTAKEVANKLGLKNYDVNDPATNLMLGTYYLEEQLQRFKDPRLALAAYNAGPDKVREWISRYGANWDTISRELKARGHYRETVNYVPKIMARYQQFAAA